MPRDLVFLGGGRITTALLSGLRQANYRGPIVVHDRNAHKLAQLRRAFGITTEPHLNEVVNRASILIVAVRPQDVPSLLASLPRITRPIPALSLAAGIPLTTLRKLLGPPVRWARAMPSPAARSGHGLTALTIPRDFPDRARRTIERLFSSVGKIIYISDRHMDAFTVAYSSSHHQYALQVLYAAAQKLGLPRHIALIAATHALGDSVVASRESGSRTEELLHEAVTPGGIAAECMAALDAGGYPRIVERALRAGVKRARKFATAAARAEQGKAG